MPHPRGPDDLFKPRVRTLPLQRALGLLRRGDEDSGIAAPAPGLRDGDRTSRDGANHIDDLPDGVPRPVAQIVRLAPALSLHDAFEGANVGRSEIGHMDVVADARPVGRGIVGSEDRRPVPTSERDVQQDRNEVRLRVVMLSRPDEAVRACRVEVSQRDAAQAECVMKTPEHRLDEGLALAVRVRRKDRSLLRNDGNVRLAVDSRRRREDQVRNRVFLHDLKQRHGSQDVHAEILVRPLHRLPHERPGREVDHPVDPARPEKRLKRVPVADIPFDESAAEREIAMAATDVVEHDDLMPCLDEGETDRASDISGAAGDKNHATVSFRACPLWTVLPKSAFTKRLRGFCRECTHQSYGRRSDPAMERRRNFAFPGSLRPERRVRFAKSRVAPSARVAVE